MRLMLVGWFAFALDCAVMGQVEQPAPTGEQALAESMRLHSSGDAVGALKVLEPAYAIADIELSYYDGLWSTEQFLKRLYVQTGRVDQGVTFLFGVLRQRTKSADGYGCRELEDQLLDLALMAKRAEVALQVADQRKAREDYAGWDVDYARIHAVRGDVPAALKKLESYFRYELADSKTRVLVLPEFYALHPLADFQRLVTEPDSGPSARAVALPPRTAVPTLEEVRAAAAVFKKIEKPEDARSFGQELAASHQVLLAGLQEHHAAILAMVQAETDSTAFRVGMAGYLLMMQDPAVTRRVAKQLQHDTLTAFPQQLFRIAYATAACDPEAARPFLMQMLSVSGDSLSLPQHAMSFDWSGLLMQAFGCAEAHYRADLLRWAAAPDAAQRQRATDLLLAFQEPQLLPILTARHAASHDAKQRCQCIEQIGYLCLPEARQHLLAVQQKSPASGVEAEALSAALEYLKAPERAFPENDAIAIVDPKMRDIFFANLAKNRGSDVSYLEAVLWATAKPKDVPALLRVRARTLTRMSDEALADFLSVAKLIAFLRWQ